MGQGYFRKLRVEGRRHADDPVEPGLNPWVTAAPAAAAAPAGTFAPFGAPPGPSTTTPTGPAVSAMAAGEPVDDRSQRYNDWAERMRVKRERFRQQLGEEAPTSSYWSTDALFEESRRIDNEELYERPNPWRVRELLAVLDLRDNATRDEIGAAYRRLAKQHHPDRFVAAEPTEQAFHEEQMREINAAYRALKTLDLV